MNGNQKIQGMDYVYNIDGSLKSINNSDAVNAHDPGNDGNTSGFPDDVFGMTLDYYSGDYTGASLNTLGAINATGYSDQFGGLVKARRWHSFVDNDVTRAYVYEYDDVNRLRSANWGSVSSGSYTFTPADPESYKESISGYDKNGNIQGLSRNGKGETVLGDYSYHYKTNKNQLSSVTGGVDPVEFKYDTIGRMTRQTEGTAVMNVTYNAYGLVRDVKNGDNKLMQQYFYDDRGDLVKKVDYNADTLRKNTFYVYDASGNVLAIYESTPNSAVTLVEQPIYGMGRIGVMKPTLGLPKYLYEVTDHLGNVRAVIGEPVTETPIATYEQVNMPLESVDFLRYDDARRVSSHLFDHTNESRAGTPTTSYFNDFSTSFANFQTHSTITLSLDAGRLKAAGAVLGSHAYKNVATITGRNYKVTCDVDVSSGPSIKLHAFDIPLNADIGDLTVSTNGTYSYSFIARSSSTAIMFTSNGGSRDYYIDNLLVEDVSPEGTYAERLNGSANEKYGLARWLVVAPGDVVSAEVYAKYVDTTAVTPAPGFLALLGQIAAKAAGVVTEGGSYNTSISSFPFAGLGITDESEESGPKAYLNWLIFDRYDTLIDAGYDRLSNVPKEHGQNVDHEKLQASFTITEPGYVYLYLSNEEPDGHPVEVYFDDFKITHVKGKILAGGDYYPFGLPIDTRQVDQEKYRFGYQGQFAEKDSLTNWNTFQLRMYDARFGRWLSPDPYGQFASPYVGMGNVPNASVDADGGWSWITAGIGAAVGAAAGYAKSKDWQGALIGGLGVGVLGGAAFNQVRLPYNSFSDYSIGLSPWVKATGKAFANVGKNIANAIDHLPTQYLDEIVVNGKTHTPKDFKPTIPGYQINLPVPNFRSFNIPHIQMGGPCPDFAGVSFYPNSDPKQQRIMTGGDVIKGMANYLKDGGEIAITSINSNSPSSITFNDISYRGKTVIGSRSRTIDPRKDIFRQRVRLLVSTLTSMGAPRRSIHTKGARYVTSPSEDVGFDCL